jgi:hypothetical protein
MIIKVAKETYNELNGFKLWLGAEGLMKYLPFTDSKYIEEDGEIYYEMNMDDEFVKVLSHFGFEPKLPPYHLHLTFQVAKKAIINGTPPLLAAIQVPAELKAKLDKEKLQMDIDRRQN